MLTRIGFTLGVTAAVIVGFGMAAGEIILSPWAERWHR